MSENRNDELMVVKAKAITLFNSYQDDDECVISLADNWEMFGYTQKGHTFAAFEKCGFIEGVDYFRTYENSSQVINGKEFKGKPILDYLMSPRTVEHFGMMVRTEKGRVIREAYRECRKIAQNIPNMVAAMIAESLKPIVDGLNSLVGVVNTLSQVVENLDKRVSILEERFNGKSIERAVEPKYVGDVIKSSNALTRIRQHYITCYGYKAGLSAFHRVLSSACQEYGFKVDIGRWGLMVEPAAALDSRVITYLQKSQEAGFELREKRTGVRNRISPALGQMNFLDN